MAIRIDSDYFQLFVVLFSLFSCGCSIVSQSKHHYSLEWIRVALKPLRNSYKVAKFTLGLQANLAWYVHLWSALSADKTSHPLAWTGCAGRGRGGCCWGGAACQNFQSERNGAPRTQFGTTHRWKRLTYRVRQNFSTETQNKDLSTVFGWDQGIK